MYNKVNYLQPCVYKTNTTTNNRKQQQQQLIALVSAAQMMVKTFGDRSEDFRTFSSVRICYTVNIGLSLSIFLFIHKCFLIKFTLQFMSTRITRKIYKKNLRYSLCPQEKREKFTRKIYVTVYVHKKNDFHFGCLGIAEK